MIEFEWAMHERTAEFFREILAELGITVREAGPDGEDARADEEVFLLLEHAGFMMDQQVRMPERGSRVLLSGSASTDELAHALSRFAQEPDAGGVLIDTATPVAQITEVRGVNGAIVVLAEEQGARQLQVDTHVIASALEHALQSSA